MCIMYEYKSNTREVQQSFKKKKEKKPLKFLQIPSKSESVNVYARIMWLQIILKAVEV